jgi:hypothetical protein
MHWSRLLALVAVVGTAGCGETIDPVVRPSPAGDRPQQPRVEGRWRVVYTGQYNIQGTDRTTWQVRPRCKQGACSFLATTSAGRSLLRYSFDPAAGRWTQAGTTSETCVDPATDEVVVEKGFTVRYRSTLSVSEIAQTLEGPHAVKLAGRRMERLTPTTEGQGGGCRVPATVGYTVQATRTDPPRGKRRVITRRTEASRPAPRSRGEQ